MIDPLEDFEVVKGAHTRILMTEEVASEVENLDATKRAQLMHRMQNFADRGPQALLGSHFNPDEGRYNFSGCSFKMGAFKTHKVRLYGAYFKGENNESVFLIAGFDGKKKANKQKKSKLNSFAGKVYAQAKGWNLK